ncbi:MAG: family 78 glycoside hydrolase catalytic domain, partial [Acidimicrobiales bacterium]
GVYEAHLNGRRVGDHELTPGFTAYRKRVQVQTFDVTDFVVEGTNAVGALLSDGWWRGHGIARQIDSYGATTGFLAELHVALSAGETVVISTDGAWSSTPSHILGADLVAGEVHDLRRRVPGWCAPGTDRSGWEAVRMADHGFAELCRTVGPPVRCVEELAAVSITELAPGRHVVDFGQNSNGWVRLSDVGPEGTTLTITHGEWLDPNGDVTQENIKHSRLAPDRGFPIPFQVDVVTSAGDGTPFEPRHSTKGFQYVRVEGHPGPLDPSTITSVVVHSDLERVGDFACSDDRINQLHHIAEWSLRGNACDIPTDCPTRERSGWTGDWQIYVGTAAYLYDVTDFSAKWLLDVAAEQRPDGAVLHIVPDPHDMEAGRERDFWRDIQGSAGWGDAAVHVPWELYCATGRTDVLEQQFDSMQRWVDFAAQRAATNRYQGRIDQRPDPLPHEISIWDSGFHFGEWLEAGSETTDELARILKMDHGPIATAYLHRSADELARIAGLLGDTAAVERYGELAANVRDAWQAEFLDDDGHVLPTAASQANLARALTFGLIPDEHRPQVADDLVALIRKADSHIGTGFLATPFLLPVLADHGHLDVAYGLLLQDTPPSWLAMVDAGATTIWESWEALQPDRVADSLNHYSKARSSRSCTATSPASSSSSPPTDASGWRRCRGGISSARTHHDSPHGRIEVAWELQGDEGILDVTVPAGTEADLVLPDSSTHTLPPGEHRRTWTDVNG